MIIGPLDTGVPDSPARGSGDPPPPLLKVMERLLCHAVGSAPTVHVHRPVRPLVSARPGGPGAATGPWRGRAGAAERA
ncbi:hypothetical protein KPATCC21470_1226 [Kitasatospora purpeofusca]